MILIYMNGKTNSNSGSGNIEIKNSKQNKYLAKIDTSISKNNFVEIGSQTQKSTLLKTLANNDNLNKIEYEGDNEWLISYGYKHLVLVKYVNDSFMIYEPVDSYYPKILGKINENTWVIKEKDASINTYNYIRILTFDGTKLISNEPVQIKETDTVSLINNTKILVMSTKYFSDEYYGKGYCEIYGEICTISGVNITKSSKILIGNTPKNNYENDSGFSATLTPFALTNNKCLINIAYKYQQNSWGTSRLTYGLIGCEILNNTLTSTDFVNSAYNVIQCVQLSDYNIIGVAEYSVYTYMLKIIYSSNTLTITQSNNYETKSTGEWKIVNNNEMFSFYNYNSSEYMQYVKITSSGISLTNTKIIDYLSLSDLNIINIDELTFIFTYYEQSTTAIACDKVSISNGNPTVEKLDRILKGSGNGYILYNVGDTNKSFYLYRNEIGKIIFIEYVSGQLKYYTKTLGNLEGNWGTDYKKYCYWDNIHDCVLIYVNDTYLNCVGIHHDYVITNVPLLKSINDDEKTSKFWRTSINKICRLYYYGEYVSSNNSPFKFVQEEYIFINNKLAIPGKCIELSSTKIDGVLINDATDNIAGTVLELA